MAQSLAGAEELAMFLIPRAIGCNMQHLIMGCTVLQLIQQFSDISTGSQIDLFKFQDKYGVKGSQN